MPPSPEFELLDCSDPRLSDLVAAAGLPTEDLCGAGKRYWGIARDSNRLVAAGGLETHGRHGIVRSFAVDLHERGAGLGRSIVAHVLNEARRAGAEEVWLLTETADRWFEKLGFEPADRSAAPAAIAASSQFAGVCPASATALRMRLDDTRLS